VEKKTGSGKGESIKTSYPQTLIQRWG